MLNKLIYDKAYYLKLFRTFIVSKTIESYFCVCIHLKLRKSKGVMN